MTQEEAKYIIDVVKPLFLKWKKEQVLRMPPEVNVEFRKIYLKENGRPLPTCSSCVVDGMLSMVIRAEAQYQPIQATEIEITVEPKPKKRAKTYKDIPKGDGL
jgi:hypothetical protein